jgi:hypothetical protein
MKTPQQNTTLLTSSEMRIHVEILYLLQRSGLCFERRALRPWQSMQQRFDRLFYCQNDEPSIIVCDKAGQHSPKEDALSFEARSDGQLSTAQRWILQLDKDLEMPNRFRTVDTCRLNPQPNMCATYHGRSPVA